MAALAAISIIAVALDLPAQWLNYPTPGIPRTKDGKPRLTGPAPKTRDGKPDLSGIWTMVYPKDVVARVFKEAIGTNLRYLMPEGTEIPLQPAAAALYKQRLESLGKGRPSSMCLPHGIPGDMLISVVAPFKLVQTPVLTIILFELFNHYRQILTDGRRHPTDANPSWYGYSIGTWDRNTFVVETRGFNDRSWLDGYGLPHSEALHATERFERPDFGHMDVLITIDDPEAYTRPWSFTLHFELNADTELFEDICENEKDAPHSVGR
jgi:hypothetical protein